MTKADVKPNFTNLEPMINILRILSMLEKALNRVARRNYHDRSQYPEIFFEIETSLDSVRAWIKNYKYFCNFKISIALLGLHIEEIGQLIKRFTMICSPKKGKKKVKISVQIHEQEHLEKSIADMMSHIEEYLNKMKINADETELEIEIEKALFDAFIKHCSLIHERKIKDGVSKRGKKTIVFPWSDKDDYIAFVEDKKRFRAEVLLKLGDYNNGTGHKASCKRNKGYRLRGFRQSDRKTRTGTVKKEEFPVRMVECIECGERFSLLPSFLPREKHFSIDIIGNVLQGNLHFAQSLRGVFETINGNGNRKILKSKQTILNWIRWMGTYHPATILTRAKVKGSGYFQEDEGFEKEPGLRTYTVAMVDPETLLVWHKDYVDHVDEETLCNSFEKFIERIGFKVLGVTKDKWQASTNALKSVFQGLWIGFCHRHCLKKFRLALIKYQKEEGCSGNEVRSLYKKFKKALETANSKITLEIQINLLKDPAFNHPLIRGILDEVKKNAVHYTAHKNRNGIKKTTSIVDNFLKTVKRKLRQVESFRDQEWAGISFRAMANIRNFAPFMSGAKNAHKSPFMLAQGQTFNLPWIQVMNVHNAFLFG